MANIEKENERLKHWREALKQQSICNMAIELIWTIGHFGQGCRALVITNANVRSCEQATQTIDDVVQVACSLCISSQMQWV